MNNNTYSKQRAQNLAQLEEKYNKTLEEYLEYYETYLMYKSKHVNNEPELAENEYKQNVLDTNNKLLEIIKDIYDSIEESDKKYSSTKSKNKAKRDFILKNQQTLLEQRKMILENKTDLITKEAKIKQISQIYKTQNKRFTGIMILDIIIGLLLFILLGYAISGVQYMRKTFGMFGMPGYGMPGYGMPGYGMPGYGGMGY